MQFTLSKKNLKIKITVFGTWDSDDHCQSSAPAMVKNNWFPDQKNVFFLPQS